jgi:hypothetical protein
MGSFEGVTEMKDAEYNELKLIMAICPHQGQWPRRYSHWEKLHEAVDKAREFVRTSYSLMDAIDQDPDFSREGKQRQKRKIAAQAIADIQALDTLDRAREAVSAMQEKWSAKIGLVLKPQPMQARRYCIGRSATVSKLQ